MIVLKRGIAGLQFLDVFLFALSEGALPEHALALAVPKFPLGVCLRRPVLCFPLVLLRCSIVLLFTAASGKTLLVKRGDFEVGIKILG